MTTSSAVRSPLPAYQAASRLPSLSSTTHEAWLCLELAGKIAVRSKNAGSPCAPTATPAQASARHAIDADSNWGLILKAPPDNTNAATGKRARAIECTSPSRG